jgi:hypothetical protein
MVTSTKIKEPGTIVYGAEGIAPVIDRTVAQTFRMLQRGLLPAKKLGPRLWIASVADLKDLSRWPEVVA